jgi:alkylation response protein AidB-like acyl-CoA dehydrogenase
VAFDLGEEQRLLGDALRRLLDANYGFDARRSIVASPRGYSPEMWRAFADMGLLGAPFSEAEGGGGSFLNTLVIQQAFGRALVVEPYLATVILAGGFLQRGATAAQRARFIPPIIQGDSLWAAALSEAGGRYRLEHVALQARPAGTGFRLTGEKIAVLGGDLADWLVVAARTDGGVEDEAGISLFIVDARAPGVSRTGYRTVDGMRAATIRFDAVEVEPDALIGAPGTGLDLIRQVTDEAIAALCAEAVGALSALNEKTLEHCRTRIVFDQPLSKFQVVQHRLVDMRVAQEHAEAMMLKAYADIDRDTARRTATCSAAKVQIGREAGLIAREAVQLHGAMGITDELDVSHYFRRLTAFGTLFGDEDHHVRRYIRWSPASPATSAEALEQATELDGLSPQELAFRDEIRAFYAENLTPELRRASEMTLWHMTAFPYAPEWQKVLHRHGYGSPNWPVEFGGRDWTPTQHLIWTAETARARAPLIMSMGKVYVGPCIMKFGTPEQQAYYLPRILSGEDWWAQGYSEPGAGSDLAALQLSAEIDGDDYVLNGSKLWTTFAHNANRIFCLVRTSREGRKQQGITFLLVDMDTPGIEVRPIVNMAGDHDFNEVFFRDVRVPRTQRLGEEDHGWSVARHLLLYEHGANLLRANMENIARLGWVREIAALEPDGRGETLLADPDFSRHVAEVEIGLQAMDFAARQEFARSQAGAPPGAKHELLSLRSRELRQRLSELAMRAVAYHGLAHQPEARQPEPGAEPIGPEHALLAMPFYLTQRGFTIAGGPSEIHRNNLAKHLLNL